MDKHWRWWMDKHWRWWGGGGFLRGRLHVPLEIVVDVCTSGNAPGLCTAHTQLKCDGKHKRSCAGSCREGMFITTGSLVK